MKGGLHPAANNFACNSFKTMKEKRRSKYVTPQASFSQSIVNSNSATSQLNTETLSRVFSNAQSRALAPPERILYYIVVCL